MKRKYEYDRTFFDKINSEEKAYWLGFLYAEGNLYKTTLTLKLHSIDISSIESFKKAIKADHPIEKVSKKEAYRIRICDKNLPDKLKKVGIVPNKSDKLVFPKFLNDINKWHFIRGFFDGDGWITICKTNNHPVIGIASCSLELLKYIKNFVDIKYGVSIGSLVSRRKIKDNKQAFQLSYNGQTALVFYTHIYKDSTISMERKRNTAIEYFSCFKKELENKKKRQTSKYNGVGYHKLTGKWRASICYNKKYIEIGKFNSEKKAAIEYNKYIKKLNLPPYKLNHIT